MNLLLQEIRRQPLLWLLAMVPIVFLVQRARPEAHTLLFLLSVLAIIPLARRMSLTRCSDGVSGGLDFCLMVHSSVVTMSPKSFVPQAASFDSQVLMSDTLGLPSPSPRKRSGS